MRHLYSSVVDVNERKIVTINGRPVMKWVPVEGLQNMRCRLDLQFLRPGKDAPAAIVAGVIPDREGIMFCDNTSLLKAGMQIKTKKDRRNKEVVSGVFEIKEMPDIALDYGDAHHIEVKIIETTQENTAWPEIGNSVLPPDPEVPDDD